MTPIHTLSFSSSKPCIEKWLKSRIRSGRVDPRFQLRFIEGERRTLYNASA